MKKIKISSILTYFFLAVGAIIMVFPFFWMITGSFKTSQEVSVFPPKWLPGSLNLENYIFAFKTALLSELSDCRREFGNGLYGHNDFRCVRFFPAALPGTICYFRCIARDDDGAV